MRNYVRQTYEQLEALGFNLDEEATNTKLRVRVYRHPYDPEQQIKVWEGASQQSCLTIQRRAHEIAGLGSYGPKIPTTLKERVNILRAEKKSRTQREQADYHARVRAVEDVENAEARRQELIAVSMHLMGSGRPRTF